MAEARRQSTCAFAAFALVLVTVLGGCGNTSPWTALHTQRLAQSRQVEVDGLRDANGRCIYDLSWMPPGTIEQDIATDNVNCRVIAEIGPVVPNLPGTQAHTSNRSRCLGAPKRQTPASSTCRRKH